MGYFRNHAILVTDYSEDRINEIWKKAKELFVNLQEPFNDEINVVTPIFTGINLRYSFCVLPDGSKEGWPPSDWFDKKRAEFIGFLKKKKGCDWVEVCYGDEYGPSQIINDSNAGVQP